MAKRDISKTLLKGSAKKRILLLASDYASKGYGGKGFLTDEEFSQLMDSFKTPQEIRLYNTFRKQDELLRNAIGVLYQYKNAFYERLAYITCYSLLWDSYKKFEDIINEMLYTIPKKTKEKAIQSITGGLYFAEIEKDENEEGFIRIVADKEKEEYNLKKLIMTHKSMAVEQLIKVKTLIKAMRDSNEEKDFTVKVYRDIINSVEKEIKEKISTSIEITPTDVSKKAVFKLLMEKKNLSNWKLTDEDKLSALNEEDFIYPNYDKIEIDEADYKFFREKLI